MSNLKQVDQVTSLHKNNELQILCFRLEKDKNLYAVNVFKIREVVKYRGSITMVTHSDSSLIDGLITIRDLTVPLIDMRKWFHYNPSFPTASLVEHGIKKDDPNDDEIVMICDFSRYTIGVKIYEADRIMSKKWTDIEQSAGVGGSTKNSKLISRTRYFDGSLVQIVDIEKMLTDVFPWIEIEKEEELSNLSRIEVSKKILIADDSPSVLKTMGHILNTLGVEYTAFTNGRLLLDYVLDSERDISDIGLIITDLEMPEASGFEVIKTVKANPNVSHIPIVVNSSMSGSSNEEMARSLKADDFISKSNPSDIERSIINLMLK